jgi:signal recognition particle subunit SRP54
MEQLRRLGKDLGIPVLGEEKQRPVEICRAARDEAAQRGLSPLILDTAGRLHIDEEMLEELRAIKKDASPHHVLLVVDAMTGQDAVTVAEKFNAAVGIDAVVLTKMDGDARGGAALSVREVTGRPIAFVGVGEKTDALEPFHPDRLAQRILGMGDVLSSSRRPRRRWTPARPRRWRGRSARTASPSKTSRPSSSSFAPWAPSGRSWR